MGDSDWNDGNAKCFGMLIDGRAQPTGIRQRGEDATVMIVVNSYHDGVAFTVPECPGGNQWLRLIDTNLAEDVEKVRVTSGDVYEVTGRSLLVFALQPAPAA
jgi:glycogen operon protein